MLKCFFDEHWGKIHIDCYKISSQCCVDHLFSRNRKIDPHCHSASVIPHDNIEGTALNAIGHNVFSTDIALLSKTIRLRTDALDTLDRG